MLTSRNLDSPCVYACVTRVCRAVPRAATRLCSPRGPCVSARIAGGSGGLFSGGPCKFEPDLLQHMLRTFLI